MKLIQIAVSRQINARPSDVFDAWLDPRHPASIWYGCQSVVDAVEGGFYYSVVHQDDHNWAHYGRFLSLKPSVSIEATFMSEGTRGRETLVTITFVPEADGTKLTLLHAGIPGCAIGRMQEMRWTRLIDRISERVASLTTAA